MICDWDWGWGKVGFGAGVDMEPSIDKSSQLDLFNSNGKTITNLYSFCLFTFNTCEYVCEYIYMYMFIRLRFDFYYNDIFIVFNALLIIIDF